jgi:hypothetical protein
LKTADSSPAVVVAAAVVVVVEPALRRRRSRRAPFYRVSNARSGAGDTVVRVAALKARRELAAQQNHLLRRAPGAGIAYRNATRT